MTISIWRYSHLALAVSSCIFIVLASFTGIILSFEAVDNKIPSYEVSNFNDITLAESLPVLTQTFPEITEIQVDEKKFVTLKGFDEEGTEIEAYINPLTGKVLGTPQKQSDFFKWVTALHRSLFLHETGRFFVGVTSFLLLLIAVSGIILVVQRQRGFRRFFSKVVKEYFAQYYHVVLGRLMLIPILLIALTGVWLSLVRFNVFPDKQPVHKISISEEELLQQEDIAGFPVFKNTTLADVRSIVFPFAGDPEEYYLLKLKDREVAVNQFNGTVLSDIPYPFTDFLTQLSLTLHTGRSSIIGAVILAIASVNILFFIYSGFTITLKRKRGRIRNKYRSSEAKYIILAGSENGSTLQFAAAIHKQLLAAKQVSFLGEPNQYGAFPKAEHLLIFTSTYGLGDPPDNSKKLLSLIEKYKQDHYVKVSVVGFGSHAYPDFCGFAKNVSTVLAQQSWAQQVLPLHTVNDKSQDEFVAWVKHWNESTGHSLDTIPAFYSQSQTGLQKMMVLDKTTVCETDHTFLLTLHAGWRRERFTSGDLLAIYPANDGRVRFYSVAKIKGNIQLVVKLYPGGLGSQYLYNLQPASVIYARIIRNAAFHFPRNMPVVVMIANGTGIAPFLGMVYQNKRNTETYLYCGFRKESSVTQQYRQMATAFIEQNKLRQFHVAFSREGNMGYVTELIKRDADFFASVLDKGGVIMLCGSLAMQKDVEAVLNTICTSRNKKSITWYKMNGQVLEDCY